MALFNYNTFIPTTYDINDVNNWKKSLTEEGYAVIRNILSEDERNNFFNLFKKDIKTVSNNINWEDSNTWHRDNLPIENGTGMAVSNGLSHADFMWYLRTNKGIKGIFEEIHQTKDLVASFDGFSLITNHKQKPGLSPHIDINPYIPLIDTLSIQGSYNYFSVEDYSAGFIVAPKSNNTWMPSEYYKNSPTSYVMVEEDDLIMDEVVKLLIPANCFTLWDSYTVHGSTGMSITTDNNSLNRLTAYITYFPKYLRSDKIRRRRLAGYYLSECCGHYAIRHDVKRMNSGYVTRHLANEYNLYKTTILEDSSVPPDRLELI